MKNYVVTLSLSIIVSSIINYIFLENKDSLWFFVLPAISWSYALVIPINNIIPDRLFANILYPFFSLILWLLLFPISFFIMSPLDEISHFFAFPILGAFAGFASYILYGKFVLEFVERRFAIICFILGYLGVVIYSFSYSSFHEAIVPIWQLMVGIGHIMAFNSKKLRLLKF